MNYKSKTIIATVCRTVQIGSDTFGDEFYSKAFSIESSIAEIMDWGKMITDSEHIDISAIKLSTLVD